MNTSAARKILSSGLVAEVEHCRACEVVHLHVGAITLRLNAASLHDLRDTLSRALAVLHAEGLPGSRHGQARPPAPNCH